jgi:hypothetical protein
MNACGNIVGLTRELGVSRRIPYAWRDRMEQASSSPGRFRGLIQRKQILKLKRLLANKTMEVDFLRHALHVSILVFRAPSDIIGRLTSATGISRHFCELAVFDARLYI